METLAPRDLMIGLYRLGTKKSIAMIVLLEPFVVAIYVEKQFPVKILAKSENSVVQYLFVEVN